MPCKAMAHSKQVIWEVHNFGDFFAAQWLDNFSPNFGIILLFKKKAIQPFFMILHDFLRFSANISGYIFLKGNLKVIGSIEWAEILLRTYLNGYLSLSIPVVLGAVNIIYIFWLALLIHDHTC